jgi:hypothetical protein
VACVREFAQSIKKTQGLKRSGVDANAYRWVTLFDPVKARATGEGALRHDCRRQPAAPPGIVDVLTQLTQCAPDRD